MICVCGLIYEKGYSPVPIVYDSTYKFGLSSDSHLIYKFGHEVSPLRQDVPMLDDGIVICCVDGIYTCKGDSWYFNDAPIMWGPEMIYVGHMMSDMFLKSGRFTVSGLININDTIYDVVSSRSTHSYYFLTPELNGISMSDIATGICVPMNRKAAKNLIDTHNAEALIWTNQGIHILKGNEIGVSYNPNPAEFQYKLLTNLNYMSLAYTDYINLFFTINRELL